MKFRRGKKKKKKKRSFKKKKPQRDGKRKGPWLCGVLQKKKKKKNQTCLFQSILWLQMALRVAVIKQTEKGHGRE